ncbi:signal peptidase I [Alloscardovia venturai]|uniref:Signal peptidase I n=1 Tax=Alloscardovia venturai TaxID=1769421 RepID=A0ABW2Y3E3_9BIFI
MKKEHTKHAKKEVTVWDDLLYLFGKIVLVAVALCAVYFFLFGVVRYNDNGMSPAVKDGDLVVYYRLDKRYKVGDIFAYHYDKKMRVARVVATSGDTVNITDKGLIVNGAVQQEDNIYTDTLLYRKGVKFPLKVPQGQVFALGDNRESAVDGRVFGPIPSQRTDGKVVMLMRRRNF